MRITKHLPKPVRVKCDGTSIWANTNKIAPLVHSITFELDESWGKPFVNVWVNHGSRRWDIYTDTGFEEGVSKLVSKMVRKPVKISFTEQGMQAERRASMEPTGKKGDRVVAEWMKAQRKGK